MSKAFNDSGIEKGSEKWYEMREELVDLKAQMLECQGAVEDFKDTIIEMRFKKFNELISKLDAIESELSDMDSLLGDDGLTLDGIITSKGLAKMALYQQQLINSKKQAAEYSSAIKALTEMYNNGDMTLDEYNEKLYEYQSAQRQAALSTKEARDAIIDLNVQAIEEQINEMNELIQTKKDALTAEENLYQYQKKIASDTKTITNLEKQIAALSNSTDRKDIAQRLQLEQDLQEAREQLEADQHDHSIEAQQEALDKEGEAYEKAKNEEINNLKTNLDAQEKAIEESLTQVKDNYNIVYNELESIADTYNMDVTEALLTPWESATAATQSYTDAISEMVSNINYELSKINWNNLSGSTDSDLGDSSYEDISDMGKWQKGQGGKWWFGENYQEDGNYDYASGGIYTINGHQYGFDDNGYMQTGWNDEHGDWRYFEPENGEMVKSEWRKSANEDWYYLDKDGIMATDMAVKAREDDGYYYLDNAGKWDGQTLSAEEVRKLGYSVGYKKGTRGATKGWHLMDEEGVGSEGILTDKGRLIQFTGGEIVFNPEEMKNLYDIAQDPTRFVSGFSNINANTIDMSKVQPVHREQKIEVNMNIGGVLDEAAARVLNEQMPNMIKKHQKQLGETVYKDFQQTIRGK